MIDKRNKPKPFRFVIQLLENEIAKIEKFRKDQDRICKELWGPDWKDTITRERMNEIQVIDELALLKEYELAVSLLKAKQKEAEKHEEKLSK